MSKDRDQTSCVVCGAVGVPVNSLRRCERCNVDMCWCTNTCKAKTIPGEMMLVVPAWTRAQMPHWIRRDHLPNVVRGHAQKGVT